MADRRDRGRANDRPDNSMAWVAGAMALFAIIGMILSSLGAGTRAAGADRTDLHTGVVTQSAPDPEAPGIPATARAP
jgi:hypothetical protein